VSQQIADYVGCVRATGASVASDSAKSLSAAAGVAGVTASTQGEVKDKLEKRYATVSDQNVLEIVRDCNTKTAPRAEGEMQAASNSDPQATPTASQDTGPAVTRQDQGASSVPSKAGLFVGTWHCLTTVDVSFPNGTPLHLRDLAGDKVVLDNGDGTVMIEDLKPDKNHNPLCPSVHWSVRGSTATAIANPPCADLSGTVWANAGGPPTAVLRDRGMTINASGTYTSPNGAGRGAYTSRCVQ
jgi:hypothetical protein